MDGDEIESLSFFKRVQAPVSFGFLGFLRFAVLNYDSIEFISVTGEFTTRLERGFFLGRLFRAGTGAGHVRRAVGSAMYRTVPGQVEPQLVLSKS